LRPFEATPKIRGLTNTQMEFAQPTIACRRATPSRAEPIPLRLRSAGVRSFAGHDSSVISKDNVAASTQLKSKLGSDGVSRKGVNPKRITQQNKTVS